MSDNKRHVHAELMLQYAQDAFKTDAPYELWEFFDAENEVWEDIFHHPNFHPDFKYRRKPEMITVGKVSFPIPISYELEIGTEYWVVGTIEVSRGIWEGNSADLRLLKFSRLHLTNTDAMLHLKALIKISKGEF
ncbi:hypothetical protein QPK14_18815 [Photorhabdus temperata subsp. temperata]